MAQNATARLFALLTVCVATSNCTNPQAATTNAISVKPTPVISKSSGQPDIDADLEMWLRSTPEATVDGLVLEAVDAPSIRKRVKSRYGGIKPDQFCQYFSSVEFHQIAAKLVGKPVVIVYEPDASQIYDKSYPPNSYLLFTDGPEVADHFNCDNVGPDGKKQMGGSGISISKPEKE